VICRSGRLVRRRGIARDIDPLKLKHAERAARIAAEAKQVTFK
jgi:hypothetical protein